MPKMQKEQLLELQVNIASYEENLRKQNKSK